MIEKFHKISSYDVFPNGSLKLSALQKYMQQAAREDCDNYGATYPKMRESGMVFVITKLSVELYDVIKINDKLKITSINNRVERTSFYREFLFYIGERLVGAATTIWVLMDFVNRRVLRPSAFNFEIPSMNLPIESRPIRRNVCGKNTLFEISHNHKVRYTELDENNHMNNAEYADLLYDYATFDFENHELKSCEIHFLGEAAAGDELALSSVNCQEGFIVSASNKTNGRLCFEAEIKFYNEEELKCLT